MIRAMFAINIAVMMFVVFSYADKPIFMALYGVPAIAIGIYSIVMMMKCKGDEDFYILCTVCPVINACIFYTVIITFIILKTKGRS